jgi:hypothetical protein
LVYAGYLILYPDGTKLIFDLPAIIPYISALITAISGYLSQITDFVGMFGGGGRVGKKSKDIPEIKKLVDKFFLDVNENKKPPTLNTMIYRPIVYECIDIFITLYEYEKNPKFHAIKNIVDSVSSLKESKIVIRFWIIGVLLALLSLATLKVR